MHTCLWNEPPNVSDTVVFAELEWKISLFLKYKNGESDLKILLFNYWSDLALGSVEIYFLEVGAYASPKKAITGVVKVVFAEFEWRYQFFKHKTGGVGPKSFIVLLLKWSCLRLSRNIFSGICWIKASETSHHGCVIRSLLLNLSENITVFEIEKWGSRT